MKKDYRLKMEKKLGRLLQSTELVHHKNLNPSDNRLSNLEVLSRSEHNRLHAKLRWEDRAYKRKVGKSISRAKKKLYREDSAVRAQMLAACSAGGRSRKGIPLPKQVKDKMSKVHLKLWASGSKHGMTGKRHSAETLQKMRDSALRCYRNK